MSRYDLGLEQIAALIPDEPRFRAAQILDGLYRRLSDPESLTDLPIALRRRVGALAELAPALEPGAETVADGGGTRKWLFRLADGPSIETVLMHHPRHSTVCVSSQAGCAMGCQFCATGDAGYQRHLSVGEILEQVVRAARASRDDGRRLDHVVFMGMGEPLANFGRVWGAVERIVGDLKLSARHITISTVGLVPQIRELADKALPVNLAVSLHAANDALRDELVPINRRYPIAELCAAIEAYSSATHRRVSFEWVLIDGVNDRDTDAAELAGLARGLGVHVNLIPLNPTTGGLARGLRASPRPAVVAFREALARRGVNVTVRRTRGQEIDAACGQLAAAGATPPAHAARPGMRPRGLIPLAAR